VAGVDGEVEASLRELGYSQYEARIYLGLLRHGPLNGNELSKRSGVPSSKVYGVLDKLAATGVVYTAKRSRTTVYACIAPEELLARLRRRYERPLDLLDDALPQLSGVQPKPDISTIVGSEAIIDAARAIIASARAELYLSGWAETIRDLREPLNRAAERGVQVYGMLYGDDAPPAGAWQRHSHLDVVEKRIGGRMLPVVADSEEALIAHAPTDGQPVAVRTENPVLCLVTDEYMRHELVLQQAQQHTGTERWNAWWQADPQLRSVMLGQALAERPVDVSGS
jgi:sugar-specific transcriptional regulator TrmB